MISVVVADDQAVVRDGLILLLSTSDEINVIGAAADGPEAVALIDRTQPQVALLDLRMPGLSGAEVTAELVTRAPSTRALILTTYADDEAVLPALRAGAAGTRLARRSSRQSGTWRPGRPCSTPRCSDGWSRW